MKNLLLTLAALAVLLAACNEASNGALDPADDSTVGYVDGLQEDNNDPPTQLFLSDFSEPKQGSEYYTLTINKSDRMAREFQSLKESGKMLDSLSLRVLLPNDRVDTYYFYDVIVTDLVNAGLEGNPNVRVTIKSSKRAKIQGMSINPGPDPNARKLTSTGVNTGWVHRHKAKTGEKGLSLEVFDFGHDMKMGFFALSVERNDQVICDVAALIEKQGQDNELILMLPVKSSKEYTEFKLWNARIVSYKMSQYDPRYYELVFATDDLVQLTGE